VRDRPRFAPGTIHAPRWARYVALGDSLTEGLADTYPDGRDRGWADRLAQHLADRRRGPIAYANLAVRGRLLRPIVAEQVEPALRLRPDLVSIWGGGNDLLRPNADPDALAGCLEAASARFRERGIDVLVGLGLDCKGTPILSTTRTRTAVFNADIWSFARRLGVFILDAWSMRSLRDRRMYHADRIHLSEAGHERVSQAALVGLGLAPERDDWDEPPDPLPPMPPGEWLTWNLGWARDHLAPWFSRRLRGVSSGDGRSCKHPSWVTVAPAVTNPAHR
jgi:lysophospholipase L1-like esterase